LPLTVTIVRENVLSSAEKEFVLVVHLDHTCSVSPNPLVFHVLASILRHIDNLDIISVLISSFLFGKSQK